MTDGYLARVALFSLWIESSQRFSLLLLITDDASSPKLFLLLVSIDLLSEPLSGVKIWGTSLRTLGCCRLSELLIILFWLVSTEKLYFLLRGLGKAISTSDCSETFGCMDLAGGPVYLLVYYGKGIDLSSGFNF